MNRLFSLAVVAPVCMAAHFAAHADSACHSHDGAAGDAPAHWVRHRVASDLLEPGLHLLGRNGERVRVASDRPDVMLRPDGAQTLMPWPERVDWRVYQDGSPDTLGTMMYFDRGPDGTPKLCRIETTTWREPEESHDQADGRSSVVPAAQLMQPAERMQWIYDPGGRLSGFETLQWDPSGGRWQASDARCFQRNDQGAVRAVADLQEAGCAAVDWRRDVREAYTYDDSGRLLRKLFREARMEDGSKGYTLVEHPVVHVYGADGALRAIYTEDAQARPYRLPHVALLRSDRSYSVWVLDKTRLTFQWSDTGFPAAERPWQIVSLHEDEVSPYEGRSKTLAKGRTDKKGIVKSARAEADAIWQAMQNPSRLTAFVSAGIEALLVPQVAPALWNACRDPDQTSETACP